VLRHQVTAGHLIIFGQFQTQIIMIIMILFRKRCYNNNILLYQPVENYRNILLSVAAATVGCYLTTTQYRIISYVHTIVIYIMLYRWWS